MLLPSLSEIASMRANLDAHDIASVLGADPSDAALDAWERKIGEGPPSRFVVEASESADTDEPPSFFVIDTDPSVNDAVGHWHATREDAQVEADVFNSGLSS